MNSLTCFLVLAIEEGLAGSEDNCYRIHGRQMTAIKLFLRLCVLSPMSATAHDLYDVISKRLRRLHSIDSYEPFYFVFTDRNQNQDYIMNCFFSDAYELFYNNLSLFEEWLSQAKEIELVQKTVLDERAFLWSVFLTEAQQLEHVLFNEKPIRLEQHPYIKKLRDRMDEYKKYVGP
ncbi:hypothetical protein [Endozoicomonas sp. SESOKO4]|uniref:hypothetical protein n=2 Tax=Endozoicomonas TaxID=305899 RepID=UPI0021487CDD|nr:hypothetical protein [Endozoicomonas sp. SESOKO4]